MADGIHVFNLPERTTEKQLKVYFSNPKNSGGQIRQILYPLPHDSAVILFYDTKTVRSLLQKQHVFREQKLSVRPLPKQIFGVTKVELESSVSLYIERNPNVVDELQYVGELAVDFHYEKEIYILKGNWYQLEWALHYLDNLLDKTDLEIGDKSKAREKEWRNLRKGYGEIDEECDVLEPKKHEIKKPNIPTISKAQGSFARNYKEADKTKVVERKQEIKSSSKYASRTVRKNLLDERDKKGDYENRSNFKSYGEEGRNDVGCRLDDSGSDNENHGTYYTAEDFMDPYTAANSMEKFVTFSYDTNFSENKSRLTRTTPKRTKGIDVAQTDFGEVPLIHEIIMPSDLKVKVLMDDISKQSTDGIINPTSPDLMSMFGASRAILQAGGSQMQREMQEYVKKNGKLGWAEVCDTKSGGTLNKNVISVIHTVGPGWNEEKSEEATHYLVCTYINCLMYADSKLWLQTVATPVISSGNFGFPLDVCIQAFYDALLLFTTNGHTNKHLKEVHLVCFDQDTSVAAIVLLQSLFDCDTTQALSAATDRYNNRFLKTNFAAENFNMDEVLGMKSKISKPVDDKQTISSKQKKNKNAMMNMKMDLGEDKDTQRSKKNESDDQKQGARKSTNLELLKDMGNKERKVYIEKFKLYTHDPSKHVDLDSSEEESIKDVLERESKLNIGKRQTTDKRSNKVLPSPDDDVKKSVQNIERPKFFVDEDDHGDEGEFSVGIIGGDKYFKKFEDLIVIDDKLDAEDEENFKRQNDDKLDVNAFNNVRKKQDREVMSSNIDGAAERKGYDCEEREKFQSKIDFSENSENQMNNHGNRDEWELDKEVHDLEIRSDKQQETLNDLEKRSDKQQEALHDLEIRSDKQQEFHDLKKRSDKQQELHDLEIRSYKQQEIHDLEIRSDTQQEFHDLEIRSDKLQEVHDLEIRSDNQQEALHDLEIRSDKQQEVHDLEIKSDKQEYEGSLHVGDISMESNDIVEEYSILADEDKEIVAALDRELGFELMSTVNDSEGK